MSSQSSDGLMANRPWALNRMVHTHGLFYLSASHGPCAEPRELGSFPNDDSSTKIVADDVPHQSVRKVYSTKKVTDDRYFSKSFYNTYFNALPYDAYL